VTLATGRGVTAGALWAGLAPVVGSRSDAKWILCHVTGMSAGQLRTSLEDELPSDVVAEARRLAARCGAGEPVQYVIGHWAFRSLELGLDPRVLIPRPETEVVAGAALEVVCGLDSTSRRPVVADLGTGSGAIALSLLLESPWPLEVWATDISSDALAVAERNLQALGNRATPGATLQLSAGSWYTALPVRLRGQLDLVVANPPYVARQEWETLDARVREHEPYTAHVPGERGTEAIEAIVAGAPQWLVGGGALVVEIGADQGAVAAAAASSAGMAEVAVRPDLAGRNRVLVARHQP